MRRGALTARARRGALTARARRGALTALPVAATALALSSPAQASNRRIGIGDFKWSEPVVNIDLGEHVTWYWIGPDTIHSVTGYSPNDAGTDSDPKTSLPRHNLGDTFSHTFDAPGTYLFRCKLHRFVRGEVVVSSTPGDPVGEPDRIPSNHFDLKPPVVGSIRLDRHSFRHRGTAMRFALDERAHVDADYYRLTPRGGRVFAGWAQWNGYVGYNDVRFGAARKHFKARPGAYVALIRGTDLSANEGEPKVRKFRILPSAG
ncbi:MAG: plastocyanin/azurin family copper-binding protein [Solirubrobacterales bacterium]